MEVTIRKTESAQLPGGGTGMDLVYSPGRYGIFNGAGEHVGNVLGNDTQAFGTRRWTAYRITETGGFQRIGRPHYRTFREAKAKAVAYFADR